ncbi:MAG: hypothetical protein ACI8W1_002205, partial [Candidatus Azotimanducaceae bacterium]
MKPSARIPDTELVTTNWFYLLLGRSLTRLIILLPAIAAVFIVSPHIMAASRGLSVEIRASEAVDAPVSESLELYANSYALIIGNDDYNNGWPKLSNAVKDAELIADVL